jgi:hypothetical protein
MATTTYRSTPHGHSTAAAVLRIVIVVLALGTAYIHATLGGLLFTLNAIGYTGIALAMVLPGPFAGARWLIRLALIGFTVATIVGWVAFGARFSLAYVDKVIELGLILALVIETWRTDGNPIVIARRIRRLPSDLLGAARAGW